MRTAIATTAACMTALMSAPSSAHHSTAAFDTDTELTVEGVLLRYEWANPHVYLWVEQQDDSGASVTWEVEGSPPAFLARQGLTQDVLTVGERVTINGHPGRDPARHTMLMDTLAAADGDVVALGQEIAVSAIAQEDVTTGERASGLSGTWGATFDLAAISKVMAPSTLELTEQGRAALERRRNAAEPPGNCNPGPPPGVMLAPDIKSIEVRDDAVLIRRGWDSVERTVHLNVDSHEGAVPSSQGHSIGRWEGRTLVVDTAAFAPHPSGIMMQLPNGAQKHLIERFALDDAGRSITYSFELDDPDYLVEPVAVDGVRWVYRPDLRYVDVPCDPDNARRSAYDAPAP